MATAPHWGKSVIHFSGKFLHPFLTPKSWFWSIFSRFFSHFQKLIFRKTEYIACPRVCSKVSEPTLQRDSLGYHFARTAILWVPFNIHAICFAKAFPLLEKKTGSWNMLHAIWCSTFCTKERYKIRNRNKNGLLGLLWYWATIEVLDKK